MATERLTAEEYREALVLVLAELKDLDPADALDTTRRLHQLQVHIATVVGTVSPPMDPVYGLRALRRARASSP